MVSHGLQAVDQVVGPEGQHRDGAVRLVAVLLGHLQGQGEAVVVVVADVTAVVVAVDVTAVVVKMLIMFKCCGSL